MNALVPILIDGLNYSAWLFIVAVGMTLIFGVMRVLNIAHGSLYAIGAYVTATLVGRWFDAGLPAYGSFALIFASAILVGLVLGLVLEQGLLRFLHGRDEIAIVLATFAVFLILEDVVLLVWGTGAYPAYQPYGLLGTSSIGGIAFTNYDFSLVGLAIVLGLATWWGLNRTRLGKLLLIVIHDREIAQALGINVRLVYPATFTVGAIMAALGGAYSAPMISVAPGIGVDVIILSFAVVVIGGLGSIEGAMIGAVMVGLTRAASVHLAPQFELFVIYAIMTLVLVVRPQGLFMRAQARKI
jgi:branched-chain amino acid transport system permease protein